MTPSTDHPGGTPSPDAEDEDEEIAEALMVIVDDYEDDPNCMTCGGEGFEECEDVNSAEGCWEPDCDGAMHTCPNCRGTGRAKDQRFW